jgi:hypothetical protein
LLSYPGMKGSIQYYYSLFSASALTSCSMRSGNWLYVVEELLLRDRERLEDMHGEDVLEKSKNTRLLTRYTYYCLVYFLKYCLHRDFFNLLPK